LVPLARGARRGCETTRVDTRATSTSKTQWGETMVMELRVRYESEVYSESVGETERRRRDQSARLENSHASHWAALAGNARAITGDAPR